MEQTQKAKGKAVDSWLFKNKDQDIVFDIPDPYGWYTVKFPKVHDLNTNVDMWFAKVSDWLSSEGLHHFSCLCHGTGKHKDRYSFIFFFKELMPAKRLCWMFNGDLH